MDINKELQRIAMAPPPMEALQTQKVVVMFQMKKEKKESQNNKVRFAVTSPEEKACSIRSKGTKAINKMTGKPTGGQERNNKIPLRIERRNSFLRVMENTKVRK